MQTERIVVDREKARNLYQDYKKHAHYAEPVDREIQRAYQLIAQGCMVIQAIASIKAAGVFENSCPKLALIRADAKECNFVRSSEGAGIFYMRDAWRAETFNRERIVLPAGTLPTGKSINRWDHARAIVPLIPLHLRPKRGLQNYHILFEAEWQRVVPRDPMLLRRIGKGDMWLVVAAWDLTEVERTALAARVNA